MPGVSFHLISYLTTLALLHTGIILKVLWTMARHYKTMIQSITLGWDWRFAVVEKRLSLKGERISEMILGSYHRQQGKRTNLKTVLQENKAHKIFRKTNISYPLSKKCSLFGKFDVLCFLVTPVLRFALLS